MTVQKSWQFIVLNGMWLWHSRFFRWAHKPLCDHYHHDIIHWGQYHLCRSCTLLWTGLLFGCLSGLWWINQAGALLLWNLMFITICAAFSWPVFYRNYSRTIRDIIRFFTGFSASCLFIFSGAISWKWGLLSFVILYLSRGLILNKRKRQYNDSTCQNCPEYNTEIICSGFRKQAESSREFEILASNYVMKSR